MSEGDLTKLKPASDSSSKLVPPVTYSKGTDKPKKNPPPKITPAAATKIKKTNLNPTAMTPSSSANDLSSLANTKKIASTNSIVSAAQADEDKEKLFGSTLLLAINIGNPALDVPIVIEETVSWLLTHEYSLDTVLNGEPSEKNVEKAIRKYESKQGAVFTDKSDARVVAAVLKSYLEALPEPVILSSLYYEFNSNATTKLVSVLDKLPQENKSVLRRLLDLMRHWRYKQPADSNFYEIAKFFRPIILRSQGDVSRDQYMVIAVLQYLIQEVDSTDEDSFMGCLHEPQLPQLYPGEKIIHREYRVSWGEIPIVGGNLWLTNFRLFYENAVRIENKKVNNTDFVGPWLSWVPLSSINSQEWVGHTTTPRSNRPKAISLKLHCKDFQTRTFEFDATPSLQLFITHCQRMCSNVTQLFAFHNKRDFGDSIGWDVYDCEREWRRQGFMSNEGQWKVSAANIGYKLCYSYPGKIIVPANITEEDLKRFSRCRSRNRFPVVSWRNPRRETYLLRADEPDYTYDLVNSGDVSKKRFDDTKLFESVTDCSQSSLLCMVDPGDVRTYEASYPGVKTEFFKLPNNKEMTELFNTFQYNPLINGAANKNRPIELNNNQWADVMLKLMDAAAQTSKLLERGSVVLTHPVNNDTDFIIVSLALILSDGYYRTLEGFEVLIEKEWIAHGFPFARSLGHLKTDDPVASEKSPIFLQFIEALWQLMLQYPRHFEFNERFLMHLLDEMYSCQFGTFLCNNDRDREIMKTITPSIWHAVNFNPEDYINPFYRETSRDLQLEPVIDITNYKVWNEYYLRYNQRAKRQLKKMNYHMANNGISNPQLEFAGAELFSLPIEVLRYNALQELNMARNQLNRLPYHLIYMTTIRSLILSHNPIFHIHEEYMAMLAQSLIGLQELNLNFTKLKVLPKAITKFPSLRILRVRNNNISELPASIERLVNLEVLDARCNKINVLPKGFSKLKNLRVLGLGTNCLQALPEDFFQMNSLEVLDLSKNDFSNVPDRIGELTGLVKLLMGSQKIEYISPKIGELTKLEVLSLEECSLTELPVEIGKLQNIKKLVLSTNRLTTLPADFKNLKQIEELKLDTNNLHVIPDCVTQMRTLKRLYLDNASLDELHQDIGNLVNLEELTVSKNKIVTLANVHSLGQLTKLKLLSLKDNGITALPSTLGILSETLERLELEGNKLNYPPHLKDKDAILKHLTDMLDGTRPCFRMKLMLVGQENVGKTSLLGALKKTKKNTVQAVTKVAVKPPLSTDGIDIENWSFQINTPNLRPTTNTVTLSVWDFAGQEIYYTTHQFFLSARAIYLVVWNLAQDEELSKVEFWLQSVKSRVSSAPIVLVGTHLDCLPKDVNVKTVMAKLQSKYKKRFPNIKTIAVVSTLTGKNISQLKSDIERIVAQQSHMGEELPQSYLLLEELVEKERSKRSPPTIAWDEYALLAKSCNIRSEESLKRATRFLHETGSLIYFEEEESLNKIVILDPQYLTKFMSSIITTKHNFAREGILYHIHLKQIWRPPEFPEYLHKQFIALFEKFEISFNLTAARYRKKLSEQGGNSSQEPDFYKDGQSLIPALLPEKRPVELDTLWPRFIDGPQYGRRFSFSFIPQGFFSRLMVRLLHFCETNIYWRNGILIQTPDKREAMLVEVFPHIKVLDVTVRAAGEVNLYRDVIATIETLIRIFKINVNVQVPCIHCMREKTFNPFYFPKEQCEEAAMKGSFVYCHAVRPIRIENLVPDLSMTYFEGKKIEFSEIELAEKIGEGGAAVVFRGKWNTNHVAVKKLRIKAEDMIGMSLDEDTLSKAFAEFRREVWIMSTLSHPCIVQLKGLVMDPLCVVTEYLAGGNLYEFIHDVREGSESNDISNKVNEISWPLRIKIALDMAAGLEFLHSSHPPIIHRDLKSPNVLLIHKSNEERENAPIVAKVTDFGLSGLAPTLAGREVDNPVWLAPEVLREEEYTEKADVYSFGVILYELLTRQQYFGDFKFLSDIEEKIIAGHRPPIPEGPEYQRVPEYIQVVKECWVGDSTKRPTFEQVYKRLRDIRDKYFPEVLLPPAPITDREKSEPMLQLVAPVRENTDIDTRSSSQFLGRLDTELNLDAGITSLVKVPLANGEAEVWVGATNGSISVWSSRGTFTKSFKAHSNRVHLMICTGTHVWSAAADGSLAVWNVTSKDKESFWKSADGEEVLSLTMLSTNKHILAGTSFGRLRLYNSKKCKLKKEIKLPKEIVLHSVNSIVELKEQGQIWLGSDRILVRITNKFKFVDIFEAHQGIVTSMLVVGDQVWTASSDSNIIVWNVGQVRCDQVRTMQGHSDPVNLLQAVGNNVWSCSDDKSLIIWSAKTGEMLNELCFEHNDAVLGMAVLSEKQEGRDMNIVWSGSVDRTICLWADLDSSEPEPSKEKEKDKESHSPNPQASPLLSPLSNPALSVSSRSNSLSDQN